MGETVAKYADAIGQYRAEELSGIARNDENEARHGFVIENASPSGRTSRRNKCFDELLLRKAFVEKLCLARNIDLMPTDMEVSRYFRRLACPIEAHAAGRVACGRAMSTRLKKALGFSSLFG
jgi:hypothetical protein